MTRSSPEAIPEEAETPIAPTPEELEDIEKLTTQFSRPQAEVMVLGDARAKAHNADEALRMVSEIHGSRLASADAVEQAKQDASLAAKIQLVRSTYPQNGHPSAESTDQADQAA